MRETDAKVLTEFNKDAIFSMRPVPDRARQTLLEGTYSSPIQPLDRVSSPKEFTPHEPHSSEEIMKPTSKAVPVCESTYQHTFKLIFGIGLALLLLMISFGPSVGQVTSTLDEQRGETIEPAGAGAAQAEATGAEVKSVTMSIALEEGGSIDLKPPPPDMTIETWKGREVLLIVEKVNKKGKSSRSKAVEPIDIQVTRSGKDVHIETMCGAGWEDSGMDVSFRLMIPENRHIAPGLHQEVSSLSELTSKVWKAINREALIRLLM